MIFTKTDNTGIISEYRTELYKKLTAPIDAMWELLYIASSQHYLINTDEQNIGYCCIDEKGILLSAFKQAHGV